MTAIALPELTEREHQVQLRRAVIASTVGTAIEWYDFFLYSTVTGLVFAKLFFPNSDPLVGTLEAFAIYAVGFAARPVGAAIFGHYGDRIGRKSTLIATLMLMGIATFLVALVPTYESVGIWGAVILTVLRFVQGVGVGGEWGGSVLMSMEWARSNSSRGLVASWPQFGVPCGLFLANLAVLAFSQMSGDQFLTWGWRIPFALSIVLVGVGLWIRLGILETPIFRRLVAERQIERTPMLEVILFETGSLPLIFLAVVLSLIPHDMMYGPQAALIAESFTGRLRYSGASLGYQLASVIAGGPAPLIAAWLFGMFQSPYAIAGYILVCALLSIAATAMMRDYTGKDIDGEYH
jgi:MFS family permease